MDQTLIVVPDTALDLYVLRRVARVAKWRLYLQSSVVDTVDEFITRLWEQLDYVNEADNREGLERLHTAYKNDIYVLKVYWKFTTTRILCWERIEVDETPWALQEEAKQLMESAFSAHCSCCWTKYLCIQTAWWLHVAHKGQEKMLSRFRNVGLSSPTNLVRYDGSSRSLAKQGWGKFARKIRLARGLPKEVDKTTFVPLESYAVTYTSKGSSLSEISISRLINDLSSLEFATPIRILVFFTIIIRSLAILEGFALQTNAKF